MSVHAFYLVGQRDDPRGRGGFAHLFEHLMFRTTRNLPDGVSAFITAIGGQTNASTVFGAADASERSTYVGNALAAQAERTGGLAVYLASLVATGTPELRDRYLPGA